MKNIAYIALGLIFSALVAFAHSDAFKPQFVDTLVEPYLAIQKGLSSDDLKTAQVGANSFLEAMKEAPQEGEAQEEAADLSDPAKVIAEASDIKAAREAFLELSHEMIPLVQHVGTTKDTALFVAHCPMAFGKKGGDWMQSGETVANPYFGNMMLHCGSIMEQIAGEDDEHSEHMSDGHAHSHMDKEHDHGMMHN